MISRRLALGGMAGAVAGPSMAAPVRRKATGSPVELPLKISRGLPWTTVELPDGRSFPFGLTTGQREVGGPSLGNQPGLRARQELRRLPDRARRDRREDRRQRYPLRQRARLLRGPADRRHHRGHPISAPADGLGPPGADHQHQARARRLSQAVDGRHGSDLRLHQAGYRWPYRPGVGRALRLLGAAPQHGLREAGGAVGQVRSPPQRLRRRGPGAAPERRGRADHRRRADAGQRRRAVERAGRPLSAPPGGGQ